MALTREEWREILSITARIAATGITSYYLLKWLANVIDPTRKQKQQSQKLAERLMKQLQLDHEHVKLDEYELSIAAQLIVPENIRVSWSDIGGLDEIISKLKQSVIFPLTHPQLFKGSTLLQPPKGILMHGPPGCGKTLIAKAMAKEAGFRFINLQASSLTDKWYGESQKLTNAVFTLAIKIQPTIIFIDEVDSFLRSRASGDHEATAMMKAQFMSLWDGILTDHNCQVIVMGATNRPRDVDTAILRRMPCSFYIDLPNQQQRKKILQIMLQNEDVEGVMEQLEEVAAVTHDLSGSDLQEVCRMACMYRLEDLLEAAGAPSRLGSEEVPTHSLRPLRRADLDRALLEFKGSKVQQGPGGGDLSLQIPVD